MNPAVLLPHTRTDRMAGDYARSRLNAGELKPQYSKQIRPPANVSELRTTAWQAESGVARKPVRYTSPVVQSVFDNNAEKNGTDQCPRSSP
jgi:hypothetical protein